MNNYLVNILSFLSVYFLFEQSLYISEATIYFLSSIICFFMPNMSLSAKKSQIGYTLWFMLYWFYDLPLVFVQILNAKAEMVPMIPHTHKTGLKPVFSEVTIKFPR